MANDKVLTPEQAIAMKDVLVQVTQGQVKEAVLLWDSHETLRTQLAKATQRAEKADRAYDKATDDLQELVNKTVAERDAALARERVLRIALEDAENIIDRYIIIRPDETPELSQRLQKIRAALAATPTATLKSGHSSKAWTNYAADSRLGALL